MKSGIAARVGDTAYVGLGSAGTDFFSLDLADPSEGWVRRAAFDGPATSGAAAAVSGSRIYVFSGNGKPTPDAASPIIFDTVHVYDTEADAWSTVDTTTPAGLSGAKALALSDGRIAIIGGYNKAQFDTYLADVAATDKEKDPEGFKALVEAYMGREPEAYAWNDAVLAYDPAANSWSTLGENPYLPNCDWRWSGRATTHSSSSAARSSRGCERRRSRPSPSKADRDLAGAAPRCRRPSRRGGAGGPRGRLCGGGRRRGAGRGRRQAEVFALTWDGEAVTVAD